MKRGYSILIDYHDIFAEQIIQKLFSAKKSSKLITKALLSLIVYLQTLQYFFFHSAPC